MDNPTLKRVREHVKITLHPDSETMKGFEYRDEEDSIEAQPPSEIDEDGPLPFAGLDAPLGG